jgi:beta-phosphoglucomutase-like phosphatase (HAD superfamily)
MAVASGSEEPTVRGCLEATGLIHLFETIITPKLVKHGKPAPDMFLLAAERMGIAPSECLVLEDGNSGHGSRQKAAGNAGGAFISPKRGADSGWSWSIARFPGSNWTSE